MAVILGWRRSFWVEDDAKLWLWGCVFGNENIYLALTIAFEGDRCL
jgi:hypothetical protein